MNVTHIPAELRTLHQWVCWKLVRIPGRPKPTKVPWNAVGKAKTTDGTGLPGSAAATWMSFDDAVTCQHAHKLNGIGFVFTLKDPYVGIDLDGVIGPNGDMRPEAAAIIALFPDAYIERSQSGLGVHIIVRGKLPAGARRKEWVEAYSEGRYFALTGDIIGAPIVAIPDATAALNAFHAQYLSGGIVEEPDSRNTSPSSKVTDSVIQAVLDRLRGPDLRLFSRLATFGHEQGQDQSKNDSTMARTLAKYCRDRHVIAAIMKTTALKRTRWQEDRPLQDGTRGTLLDRAIIDALREVPDLTNPETAGYRFLLESELDTEPEPPWLLPNKLAVGAFGVLYGPSSAGKSFLALRWAMELGRDGKRVVYVAAEGWHGTKRRRSAWRQHEKFKGPASVTFMSGSVKLMDQAAVEAFADSARSKAGGEPDLWIFDTLNQNMPGGDENAAKDMTNVIASVNMLKAEGGAVLILHHPRKMDENERGHSSLRNAADVMMKFVIDDGDNHRVLSCDKQKDAAPFTEERFALIPFGPSMVLEPRDHTEAEKEDGELSAKAETVLATLREIEPVTGADWERGVLAKGVSTATFARAKSTLRHRGLVIEHKRKFRVATAEELAAAQELKAASKLEPDPMSTV